MASDIQISPLSKSQEEIADLHARFSEELQNIMRTRGLSEEDKHNITSIAEVINRVADSHIKTADQFQKLTSRRNKEAIDQLQLMIQILLPLKEKEFDLAHEQLQQLREIAEVFDITLSQKNPKKASLCKKVNLKATHPQFVGREAILSKIQLSLASSKPIVLYGPPGIGKSELTIAYANANIGKYFVIWTIAAETKETREESYKALAEALNLPILEEDTYEDIKKCIHSKLEQFEEIRWLLIYDKLKEPIELPKRGGDVIITSHSCEPFLSFESIELSPLSESESIILLKQVTREEESEAMHKLAKHFDYYPLVLGQVANYIRLNVGVAIASYLETASVFDKQKLIPNERYKASLQSTFDPIKKTLPPLALKWLHVCAFLRADSIPKSFLKIWLEHLGEYESAQRILNELVNRGLLHLDSEKQIFSIHRLFQEIFKSDEGFIETTELLLSIGKSFGFDTIADWETTKKEAYQWVLHTSQLMKAAEFKSLLEEESQSLFKLMIGVWRTRNGKYSQAYKNLIEALKLHNTKPDSLIKANILNALGVCLWHQRNLQESMQKHKAAFRIQNNILKADHEDLVKTLKYIGNCLRSMGKPAEALKKYKQALVIHNNVSKRLFMQVTHLREEHIGSMQVTPEMIEKYKEALVIQKNANNQWRMQLAYLANNMGNCFYDLGKIGKAITHYQKALEVAREVLDPNHPRIAETLNNIANCFYDLGKIDEAMVHYQKALEVAREVLDPNHPMIADSLNNVGNCLYRLGKIDEAIVHYQGALEVAQEVLDSNHPKIADTLNNIGNCFYKLDNIDEAITNYQEALAIRQEVLNPNHPMIIDSLNNVAGCLSKKGEMKKAYELYIQALSICERTLGKNHLTYIYFLRKVAIYLSLEGKLDEALEIYSQIISILDSTLNCNHPRLAQSLFEFGVFLNAKEKKSDEAYKVFTRALSIFENAPGHDHNVAKVNYNMGLCLETQTKYTLAEERFLKAYQISERIYGDEHEITKKCFKATKAAKEAKEARKAKATLKTKKAESEAIPTITSILTAPPVAIGYVVIEGLMFWGNTIKKIRDKEDTNSAQSS